MAALVVPVVLVPVVLVPAIASAQWSDAAAGSGSYSSAVLAAPTSPATAAGVCVLLSGDQIVVSWTATSSTWADGYEVARANTSGGPYTVIGTTSGQSTTVFTDGPLAFSTTYFYVVRARKQSWRSAYTAEVSRTTKSALCL